MVVNCNNCKLYFNHTKEDTKCPFCHVEYGDVEEKTQEGGGVLGIQDEDEDTETEKESFKIWKSSPKKEIKKKLK